MMARALEYTVAALPWIALGLVIAGVFIGGLIRWAMEKWKR
jgi:hypothetical protein